jgi:uncharacterized protein (TIRG00374 family)
MTRRQDSESPGSLFSPRRRWHRRPRISQVVRLLVTVICVVILVRVVDLRATARMLLAVDGPLFLAAVAVAFVDRGLMVLKWYPLVQIQASSISLARAARSYFAAGLAGILIPTPISGDVFRAVALGRGQCVIPEISASILMERLLGMMGSGLLCLIALGMAVGSMAHLQHLPYWIAALLALTFLGVLLSLNRSLARWLSRWTSARNQSVWLKNTRKFGIAYAVYRDRKAVLVLVGLLSFVEQFFPILCTWILSHALGVSVTLEMLIVAIPLSMFVARLPIAVSEVGSAGAVVYFLGLFGVPAHEALALSLAGASLNIIVAVPGLFYWADAMHPVESADRSPAALSLPSTEGAALENSQRSRWECDC